MPTYTAVIDRYMILAVVGFDACSEYKVVWRDCAAQTRETVCGDYRRPRMQKQIEFSHQTGEPFSDKFR